jgi:hypothetical protein
MAQGKLKQKCAGFFTENRKSPSAQLTAGKDRYSPETARLK